MCSGRGTTSTTCTSNRGLTQEPAVARLARDESSPEVGGEDRVSIADHNFGQAMKPDDVLDEKRRDVLRRHGFRGGNEVRHLGEAIDDH